MFWKSDDRCQLNVRAPNWPEQGFRASTPPPIPREMDKFGREILGMLLYQAFRTGMCSAVLKHDAPRSSLSLTYRERLPDGTIREHEIVAPPVRYYALLFKAAVQAALIGFGERLEGTIQARFEGSPVRITLSISDLGDLEFAWTEKVPDRLRVAGS